jgi:cytochrome P450 family 6
MALLLVWPTIFVTTTFFIGLYFYLIRNFNLWKKLGVPYVKPVPLFGSLKECASMKVTIGDHLKNMYDEYSDKPYVGLFSFDQPSLLVRDLELIKEVLVKESRVFPDRIMSVDAKVDPMFGNGLFALKGRRWRQMRTNLSPVFTLAKMKNMFYLVDLCSKDLVEYLDRQAADGK